MNYREALEKAFRLQWERVRWLRSLERVSLRPLPNVWREIRELANIAYMLQKVEAQELLRQSRGSLPTGSLPADSIPPQEPCSPANVVAEFEQLDEVDRNLIRQAIEKAARIRKRGGEVVNASETPENDRSRTGETGH